MRKRVKNTVFFRNLSEDSSADASADAPAIINIRKTKGCSEGLCQFEAYKDGMFEELEVTM